MNGKVLVKRVKIQIASIPKQPPSKLNLSPDAIDSQQNCLTVHGTNKKKIFYINSCFFCFYRVDIGTKLQDEPKFIVFYSALLTLFCFKCKSEKPVVKMERNGTMVTVYQHCTVCGQQPFKWRSQPFVLGRYPAGNLLLSFAVLMVGGSISKVLLVFKHLGLAAISPRTYFYHQSRFIFPSILFHWESYQATLIQSLKGVKDTVWCGDRRFDSMGHSEKYGAYTMLCCTILKIVHFDLLQVSFHRLLAVQNLFLVPVPYQPTIYFL